MSDTEQQNRRFYAISFADDEPAVTSESLIPRGRFVYRPKQLALPAPRPRLLISTRVLVALAMITLVLTGTLGTMTYMKQVQGGLLASAVTALPTTPVVVENPYTHEQTPLSYGIQVAFTEPNFFTTTRDAYIDSSRTFLEADLATMKLRYFVEGVLSKEYPIISKGEIGSFWETPAGLYEIEFKEQEHYSTFGHVYLPNSLSFQGNFYLSGQPHLDDEMVLASTTQGGITIADEAAAELYPLVALHTPILVYERPSEADTFLYEPKIPELATPHYLIADVKSNTVLASSKLDEAVPIASLTKLMTAVVAAEYIDLDTRVSIEQPSFVESLIPRLKDRTSVSMYSLFELLLQESSNEAADVIAGEVGRDKFVELMNARAASLGMNSTHFTDPSGIDAGNVSSVGDLLRLISYIYEKRRFIIDLTAGKKLPDMYTTGEFTGLQNFNKVRGLDNFIGGKVGETSAAGQTSVTLHTLHVKGQDRVVAIIVLGSEGRAADVTALLQYAQERFGN
jgi:D-alanyl-D-alanine carboxypeptidase